MLFTREYLQQMQSLLAHIFFSSLFCLSLPLLFIFDMQLYTTQNNKTTSHAFSKTIVPSRHSIRQDLCAVSVDAAPDHRR